MGGKYGQMIRAVQARGDDVPVWRTGGRYRRQMKRGFPHRTYGERNRTETVFSVIKRRFGRRQGQGAPT